MNRWDELKTWKNSQNQTRLATCHVEWQFECTITKKEWIISMTMGEAESFSALPGTRVQEWCVMPVEGDSTVPYHCKQTARRVMDSLFWYHFDKASIDMDQPHPGVFHQMLSSPDRSALQDPIWGSTND